VKSDPFVSSAKSSHSSALTLRDLKNSGAEPERLASHLLDLVSRLQPRSWDAFEIPGDCGSQYTLRTILGMLMPREDLQQNLPLMRAVFSFLSQNIFHQNDASVLLPDYLAPYTRLLALRPVSQSPHIRKDPELQACFGALAAASRIAQFEVGSTLFESWRDEDSGHFLRGAKQAIFKAVQKAKKPLRYLPACVYFSAMDPREFVDSLPGEVDPIVQTLAQSILETGLDHIESLLEFRTSAEAKFESSWLTFLQLVCSEPNEREAPLLLALSQEGLPEALVQAAVRQALIQSYRMQIEEFEGLSAEQSFRWRSSVKDLFCVDRSEQILSFVVGRSINIGELEQFTFRCYSRHSSTGSLPDLAELREASEVLQTLFFLLEANPPVGNIQMNLRRSQVFVTSFAALLTANCLLYCLGSDEHESPASFVERTYEVAQACGFSYQQYLAAWQQGHNFYRTVFPNFAVLRSDAESKIRGAFERIAALQESAA
jgi:hypothetical protein